MTLKHGEWRIDPRLREVSKKKEWETLFDAAEGDKAGRRQGGVPKKSCAGSLLTEGVFFVLSRRRGRGGQKSPGQ